MEYRRMEFHPGGWNFHPGGWNIEEGGEEQQCFKVLRLKQMLAETREV